MIQPDDAVRLVDSATILMCTYMRSNPCQTVSGPKDCSVITSRRVKFSDFQLHLTTRLDKVVDQWLGDPVLYCEGKLTPALFKDVVGLWVISDNAYHDPTAINWLQRQRQTQLTVTQRRDAREPWPSATRTCLMNLRRMIASLGGLSAIRVPSLAVLNCLSVKLQFVEGTNRAKHSR